MSRKCLGSGLQTLTVHRPVVVARGDGGVELLLPDGAPRTQRLRRDRAPVPGTLRLEKQRRWQAILCCPRAGAGAGCAVSTGGFRGNRRRRWADGHVFPHLGRPQQPVHALEASLDPMVAGGSKAGKLSRGGELPPLREDAKLAEAEERDERDDGAAGAGDHGVA